MSKSRTILTVAFVGTMLSATAAFAQAGGADVPTDAKTKGTMENGSSSTGMSKSKAMRTMKKHHGKKKSHM